MKRQFAKPVTAVLAVSMMMSVFTACNLKGGKSQKEGRKVTADMPWYEAEVVDVDLGYDKSRETDFVYSSMMGSDDKNIYVYTNGSYKINEDEIDWENYDWSDSQISIVSVIDRETFKTVKSIDLNHVLEGNASIYNAYFNDGKIVGIANSWDEKTYVAKNSEVLIDPETGKVTEERELQGDSQSGQVYNILDYKIKVSTNWNEDHSFCELLVTSPDGSEKTVELKEHGKDIYDISAVFSIDKENVMMPSTTSGGTIYYEMNLATGELTKGKSEDYSWMDITSLFYAFNASDGNVYYNSPLGIYQIDVSKKTKEQVLSYSWCGADRNKLVNLDMTDVGDGSFILCGNDYKDGPFGSDGDFENMEFILVSFKKADTNPHAGKTILELYTSYGYVDEQINSQINKFNDTNGKYFIEITDRYSAENAYVYGDINSDDEEYERELNYFSDMGNKLTMDIINGDAPDMFLNISSFDSLKNEDYLADLTPYIGKLSSDKYFTNIIELSKSNGKLYNLPVSFGVAGIQTDSSNAGGSGVGFTTEEYEKFVKDVMNGEDVITSGQPYYFAELFDYMKDKFIVKGKADFSAPEFKVLADYVKDNVPEKSKSYNEGVSDEDNGNYQTVVNGTIVDVGYSGPAVYSNCYGYYGYIFFVEQLNGATSILGKPSPDGRGPMASPSTTIAISAHACDVDACGEFVKSLLSDEIQTGYAMNGNLVLNREIFREVGLQAVDYFNSVSIMGNFNYDGSPAPKNKIKFTSEHIDALENCIMSCSVLSTQDADIEKILIEEMPAYFSGQKNIDEVIKVAQDRVQKVLDERG